MVWYNFLKNWLTSWKKIAFLCFFYWFSPGPTGIKGATDQMLPWKAQNDPKTIPMGILYDYMSCWTTLGPFGYPRGPQNGPKQHRNGLEWLKITRMAENGTAWPQMAQMTLKHFWRVYYMIICHGRVRGIFSYWTRKGPLWSFVHCVLIHIQCVVLHTLHIVCNFKHSV